MNLYETQEFFKNLYPDQESIIEFDDNCIRLCECIMTDGLPHLIHHVEYNKVKVTIGNMPSVYVPIASHRMQISWANYKALVAASESVYMNPEDMKLLAELKEKDDEAYQTKLNEYCMLSGMSKESVEISVK